MGFQIGSCLLSLILNRNSAFVSLLLVSGVSVAEEFEALSTYSAKALIPAELRSSEAYTIDEAVTHNGYLYQYVIRSRFGNFEVQGNSMLRTRTHEMEALAEIEKNSELGVFVDGAISGLIEMGRSPFDAASNLVMRPVDTFVGIPSGVGRWFSGTSRKVKKAVDGASSTAGQGASKEAMDANTKQALAYSEQWLGVDDAERRWAAKLEVDPYSTNEVLNKAIKEVAGYDAAGKTVVKIAVPSMQAAKIVSGVNDLVWKLDPYELRKRESKKLEEAGASEDLINAFYDADWFSPTLQTIIVSAVLSMEDVSDRKVIFEDLPVVTSEVEARFVAESIALGALAHAEAVKLSAGPEIRSISDAATMPMGVTESGSLLVYLALDHVVWTEEVAEGFSPFMEVAQGPGGDMFITGTVSDRALDALSAAGWQVHQRFSVAATTAER